jgi:hypothetical protein
MEEFREPKRGDVIWADRMDKGRPYFHCGIYEGGGYVIHYAAPEGSEKSQKNAVVHQTTLDKFKDGCKLRIVEFPEGFSAEETMRRARSRIGEKDYNFFVNNCDHFATWCKTGEHRSVQADEVKKVITVLGGPAGKIICTAHDIAEDYKAPALNSTDMLQKPKRITERLEQNAMLTTAMPPVTEDIDNLQDATEYKLIEKEPADATPEVEKEWYEKAGDKLKKWTYPIAGGLEYCKRKGWLPSPFDQVDDYPILGAKVRNGIDKVVIAIKVVTGKITLKQANEEIARSDIAMLGYIIRRKLVLKAEESIRNPVKLVFGKVGSTICHIAQKVVTRIVPKPLRTAITTGLKTIGKAAVNALKTVGKTAVNFVKSGVNVFKSIFSGKK